MIGTERQESTDAKAIRLDDEFHRLVDGLHKMGFEALRLDAETPEEGIVDSTLSIIRQLTEIIGLHDGWHVPAAKLRPGMVIEWGPMSGWGGPEVLHLTGVSDPDADGMVRLSAGDFTTDLIAGDFLFELRTVERSALEDKLVDAEQDRPATATHNRPSVSAQVRRLLNQSAERRAR